LDFRAIFNGYRTMQPYCMVFLPIFETVKVIRFLFAMYILALSVYPCSDKDTCVDERKEGSVVINVDDHNHTSSEMDRCTPFCFCSCCAAHIQLNYFSDVSLVNLVHNTKLATPYFENPLLHNSKAIWQPPKLA
jgi:hypothetical protein